MAKRKRRGKIRIKQSARIAKKDSVKSAGVAPTKTISTDNGAAFKVKLRKKSK